MAILKKELGRMLQDSMSQLIAKVTRQVNARET